MRELSLVTFLTLDGVMQGPAHAQEDTRGGFTLGGWAPPYSDPETTQRGMEGVSGTGALLLGRITYQDLASYWPTAPADDPMAQGLNRMPKYVVSNTLRADQLLWNNSHLISDNVVEEIRKLKAGPDDAGSITVLGSGQLAQTLMRHDLIDQYHFWIYPVVLGQGQRLFREGTPSLRLELVDSTTTPAGVVIVTYRPDRTT